MRPLLAILIVAAAVGCGPPATPPDPAFLTQKKCDDPTRPFSVESVEVVHLGCPGPCPEYRVRVTSDGEFEYEGKKFVREGWRTARGSTGDVIPLFVWLCEHPSLYAKSGGGPNGEDTEQMTFRFRMRDGQTVVVQSDIGFNHDDLWVLSNVIDGIIGRALMATAGKEAEHESKPAT